MFLRALQGKRRTVFTKCKYSDYRGDIKRILERIQYNTIHFWAETTI